MFRLGERDSVTIIRKRERGGNDLLPIRVSRWRKVVFLVRQLLQLLVDAVHIEISALSSRDTEGVDMTYVSLRCSSIARSSSSFCSSFMDCHSIILEPNFIAASALVLCSFIMTARWVFDFASVYSLSNDVACATSYLSVYVLSSTFKSYFSPATRSTRGSEQARGSQPVL